MGAAAAAAGEPLERGRGGDGSGRRTPGAWARRPADARAVGVAAAAGGHLDADEMRWCSGAIMALTSTQAQLQGQCRKVRESWGLGSVVTRAWVGAARGLGMGVQGARVGVRPVGLAGLMGWAELEKYLSLKLFGLFG